MTRYIFPTTAPGGTAPKSVSDLSSKAIGKRTGWNEGLTDSQAKLSPIEKPNGRQARK
jgi:hypothetical protein